MISGGVGIYSEKVKLRWRNWHCKCGLSLVYRHMYVAVKPLW